MKCSWWAERAICIEQAGAARFAQAAIFCVAVTRGEAVTGANSTELGTRVTPGVVWTEKLCVITWTIVTGQTRDAFVGVGAVHKSSVADAVGNGRRGGARVGRVRGTVSAIVSMAFAVRKVLV